MSTSHFIMICSNFGVVISVEYVSHHHRPVRTPSSRKFFCTTFSKKKEIKVLKILPMDREPPTPLEA